MFDFAPWFRVDFVLSIITSALQRKHEGPLPKPLRSAFGAPFPAFLCRRWGEGAPQPHSLEVTTPGANTLLHALLAGL